RHAPPARLQRKPPPRRLELTRGGCISTPQLENPLGQELTELCVDIVGGSGDLVLGGHGAVLLPGVPAAGGFDNRPVPSTSTGVDHQYWPLSTAGPEPRSDRVVNHARSRPVRCALHSA